MKILSSLFFGCLLILPLDFLFFIGVFKGYLNHYEIQTFYNILFVDHQPYMLILILSYVFGFAFLHAKKAKLFRAFYLALLFLSVSFLFDKPAFLIGEIFFREHNVSVITPKGEFKADEIYKDRKFYYFLKDEQMIKLPKQEIKVIY